MELLSSKMKKILEMEGEDGCQQVNILNVTELYT